MNTNLSKMLKMSLAGLVLSLALTHTNAVAGSKVNDPIYRQRVAVCVGINSYDGYTQLNCSKNDATEMASLFEEYGFDDVVLITEEQATRENILGEMERFQAGAAEDDLLVFFFAGHGTTVRDGSRLAGYLVPSDCRPGQEKDSGISMESLAEMAQAMPNRHSLFLTDACYSGYASADRGAGSADGRSVQILTAGGEMDRAFESDGHGLFTRYVLDYLKEQGVDKGRAVSVTKMAGAVRSKVADETGGWQKPNFGHMGEGDVLLAKRPGSRDVNVVAMSR